VLFVSSEIQKEEEEEEQGQG